MARKYLRITEVTRICGVNVKFVKRLEQDQVIYPIIRRREKYYPLDQVDRVRVAHLLIDDMGVNLEGAEVVLHMREQMIAMQRQFNEILRLLGRELRKKRRRLSDFWAINRCPRLLSLNSAFRLT